MWRLRFRVVRTTVAGAVVAVIVAGSILVATYGEVSWLPLTVAALVGIVTTLAALRGGSPTTGLGP